MEDELELFGLDFLSIFLDDGLNNDGAISSIEYGFESDDVVIESRLPLG